MNIIAREWGNFLSETDWSYTATIRRHFPFTEMSAYKLATRLITNVTAIKKVFYSVERDRQDSMNHMHLILEVKDEDLTIKDVAIGANLSRNPKAIGNFGQVDSKYGVAYYASKEVGDRAMCYDYLTREMHL
jgi:hypothetical protein